MKEHFFLYNDNFFLLNQAVIGSGNRSLRYGDGLFETMRMSKGRILNMGFHFDRLFKGLSLLQFENPVNFTPDFLTKKIDDLLSKNGYEENARIRLMVFRGDGGIFDIKNNDPNFIIEAWPLSEKIELNETGLTVDIFPDARKSCDQFSNLKSNKYLPFAMAGLFAQRNNLSDAIVLNAFGRICESAIANIFIIKDKNIFTPPLSEGCVAGVIRRWMLERFSLKGYAVIEKNLSIDHILDADEFFLTNSIQPIRWVKGFREKVFENKKITEICKCVCENI